MPLYFQLHASIEPAVIATELAITTQPQTTSVVLGNQAVFTIIVEGGTGPYRYLWQGFTGTYPSSGSWSNLSDATIPATTSSYTYSTNPPGVGQVRYIRCVVTDATTASLASEVATMTVVASQAPVTSPVTLSSTSPYTYNFSSGGVTDPDGAVNINWDELALVNGSTTVKRSENTALTTAQGTWTMSTATPPVVTFVPAGGFTSGTSSINYYVRDLQGNTSNSSSMSVTLSTTAPPSGSLRVIPTSPAAYSRPALNEVDAYITNRSQLNTFINGSGQTAILANGEYLAGQPRVSFAGRNNKTLWAENLHQASFAWANSSDASQSGRGTCISCAGATYISLNGLRVAQGRYYGIALSGNTNFEGLPSHHITVSHCLVENMDMGAIKMDNGSDSTAPAYKSHHLTVQYSIIRNIGRNWPGDSSPYFCEGIYMGSGSNTTGLQSVEDVLILKNTIQPNTNSLTYDNRVSGEAIEAKIGCKNISIIGNDIENTRLGISTSGAAIAICVNTLEYDPGLILIEGNRIRGVTKTSESGIWQAANGIVLGIGATVRNNIITGCTDSGIRFMMKNVASNGVFPSNEAWRTVLLEHNTVLGNGLMFSQDTGEGPRPVVTSRGNLYQSTAKPSGPNFIVAQDVVPTGAQLVTGNINAQTTLTNTSNLRPINDTTLTYSGTSSVAYDINGNTRPFGTNKHYGASEA